VSADTIVPGAGNPQALNRYGYVFNNPLKYVDPSGHCPVCPFVLVLGAAYGAGRAAWEGSTLIIPGADRSSRDQVGGQLVIQVSDIIQRESTKRHIDPTLVKAILRHESAAFERRLFTPLPGSVPGLAANSVEVMQVLMQGDTASIGPGQMQLRRARELEQLGYVRARNDDAERVVSLLDNRFAVEYVAGMVSYISDQLHTVDGFAAMRPEDQKRLILLGYNQG
jgi:hypothetical protein